MSDYVTLDQAKRHLDVDTSTWDDDIELKLDAADALVLNYVTVAEDDLTERQVRQVATAILMVLGGLWLNRGADGGAVLSDTVKQVLYGLHDPALA